MMSKPGIRVLSVDDHPLLREGIAAIVNNEPDMTMVAQASTGREAIQQHRIHSPDVTLMDLRLPDMSGIDTMIAIRSSSPDARIVVLTTFEGDVEIQRALAAGARGYVLKSMPPRELADVIRHVHAGRKQIPAAVAAQLAEHLGEESLTERERDVLVHVAAGNRNRDIGELLAISGRLEQARNPHACTAARTPDASRACRAATLAMPSSSSMVSASSSP